MISLLDDDVPTIDSLIKALNASLDSGVGMFGSLQSMLKNFENELDNLSEKIDTLSNSDEFNTFLNVMSENADKLGEFIACPVQVETDKIYGTPNATYIEEDVQNEDGGSGDGGGCFACSAGFSGFSGSQSWVTGLRT